VLAGRFLPCPTTWLPQPCAPDDTAARDEIKAAILQYKVVFFRDQDLDRDQHAAFARQFGPLYVHPSVNKPDADQVPAAHQIAAADAAKYADLLAQQQAEGWDPYHSDTSWRLVPTWGAVLRAVTLPEVGGDTIWVDAGLATRNCRPRPRTGSRACT